MGSSAFYADETPVHQVRVSAFEIDPHPVTNTEFAEFIASTGIEPAERPLNPDDFP